MPCKKEMNELVSKNVLRQYEHERKINKVGKENMNK